MGEKDEEKIKRPTEQRNEKTKNHMKTKRDEMHSTIYSTCKQGQTSRMSVVNHAAKNHTNVGEQKLRHYEDPAPADACS